MNTIGIDNNLDRPRIRKLLLIGLIASVMTGIGDFLIGFGDEMEASGFAESVMANALNLSDTQLIWGGLLGALGLFLEGLAFFGIYRLMADASPKYAHIYRDSGHRVRRGGIDQPHGKDTYDLRCPICGTVNRGLYLEETDGWMECENCGKV
ncbi:MAG: hypothetical protein J6P72_07920, partial [Firmicutes bacterium]|nr:hypothetical protein [Bacillota bacterium]